jgi:hypothetical protein
MFSLDANSLPTMAISAVANGKTGTVKQIIIRLILICSFKIVWHFATFTGRMGYAMIFSVSTQDRFDRDDIISVKRFRVFIATINIKGIF